MVKDRTSNVRVLRKIEGEDIGEKSVVFLTFVDVFFLRLIWDLI